MLYLDPNICLFSLSPRLAEGCNQIIAIYYGDTKYVIVILLLVRQVPVLTFVLLSVTRL